MDAGLFLGDLVPFIRQRAGGGLDGIRMATQCIGHGERAEARRVGRQVADADQREVQLADARVLDHAGLGAQLTAREQLHLHLAIGKVLDQFLEALCKRALIRIHRIAHADLEGLCLSGR